MAEKSRLRRSISRWANATDQDARDLRRENVARATVKVEDVEDRERAKLCGRLKTVTLRPRGGVPALEAELDDGTGSVIVIWLGRRRIVGIDPGVSMSIEGRIGTQGQQRVIYNPRYELLP